MCRSFHLQLITGLFYDHTEEPFGITGLFYFRRIVFIAFRDFLEAQLDNLAAELRKHLDISLLKDLIRP